MQVIYKVFLVTLQLPNHVQYTTVLPKQILLY